MSSVSNLTDEFTILFRDKCREATIISGIQITGLDGIARSSTNPFAWHMWQYAQVKFNQIQLTATPVACPITYHISDVDYERTEISTTIMLIDYTVALPNYQVNAVFREEQSRFYYVRAVVRTSTIQ